MQRWTAVPAERDEAAARRWLSGDPERRERGIALDLVICDPEAPDEVLGEVGLGPIDWERGRAMVGFWIAAARRGEGLATEAVRILVDWALESTALDQIVAETAGGNEASAAVLRSAGFEAAVERDGRTAWVRGAT